MPTLGPIVHPACAGKRIESVRAIYRRWYQGSFALEISLIRIARSYMGSHWKGVLS